MPITIKTGALKYRKSDGTYEGINAVAQESTAQQISDIQAAGSAQIAAVQQKGTQTIASIPDDYTALSNEVSQLSEDIADITGCYPLQKVDGMYIPLNASTTDISNPVSNAGYSYSLVACAAGDVFTVSAEGGSTPRAWGFVNDSGAVLFVAPSNTTVNNAAVTAPENATHFIVNYKNGGGIAYFGDLTKNTINNVLNSAAQHTSNNGYTFIDFGEIIPNKTLTKYGYAIDGGENNFTLGDFIKIPLGNIYFSMHSEYQARVEFFDEKFRMIDLLSNGDFISTLSGTVYNNTSAEYMRIGCYRSGGPIGKDFCYAYAYQNNGIDAPLWENKSIDGTAIISTVSTTDYLKVDYPVVISSADISTYQFSVVVYDGNHTQIKAYSKASVASANSVSIPSGCYFRISAEMADGTSQISAKDALDNIIIKKAPNNIGLHTIARTDAMLSLTNARAGNIDILYTQVPLRVVCDDPTAYKWIVALYASAENEPLDYYQYSSGVDMFIPADSYYRYVIGYSNNAAITDAQEMVGHLRFYEIAFNSPEISALVKSNGLTRREFDTDTVPAYYVNHINEKIDDINELKADADVQFVFVTDYHYGTNNNTHTTRPLLTKLINNTNADMVINGGDMWTNNGANPLSFGDAKQRLLSGINETIPNAPCDWFYAFGNHDTGVQTYGSPMQYTDPSFSAEEFNKIVVGNITGKNVVYAPACIYTNYYFDVNNIRFVVLNPQSTNVNWPHDDINNMRSFLCEALMSAKDKSIVIITHVYLLSSGVATQAQALADIVTAYNARQRYQNAESSANIIADFTDCTGTVICWISGHSHADQVLELSDGTPVVIVTTDNCGAELGSLTRTPGTISENAFDVVSVDTTNRKISFTRIGAGTDREVTY